MDERLVSRADIGVAVCTTVAQVLSHLVAESDRHQGALRVVLHYLQGVCSRCDTDFVHTEAELRSTSFAGVPRHG